MRLPITIEVIVYRQKTGNYEFLLLKRSMSRGSFWQFLTGGMEDTDESQLDCAFRELKEELGLNKNGVRAVIEKMPNFTFEAIIHGEKTIVKDYVFGFLINDDIKIKLSDEHEEAKFLPKNECLKKLKFENNKKALLNLVKKLV